MRLLAALLWTAAAAAPVSSDEPANVLLRDLSVGDGPARREAAIAWWEAANVHTSPRELQVTASPYPSFAHPSTEDAPGKLIIPPTGSLSGAVAGGDGVYTRATTMVYYPIIESQSSERLAPDIIVTVTCLQSPCSVYTSPLAYHCPDDGWTNVLAHGSLCTWDGYASSSTSTTSPSWWTPSWSPTSSSSSSWTTSWSTSTIWYPQWIIFTNNTVAAGETLTLTYNVYSNYSMYPMNWYVGTPQLWIQIRGPLESTAQPTLFTIAATTSVAPIASATASPWVTPYPSLPALPSGSVASAGNLQLSMGTPLTLWVDGFCYTYIELPFNQILGGRPPVPFFVDVTANINVLDFWVTPYRYNCASNGWTNAYLFDPTIPYCTWSGSGYSLQSDAASYVSSGLAAPGNMWTYRIDPSSYLFPSVSSAGRTDPNLTSLWLVANPWDWNNSTQFTVNAYWSPDQPPTTPSVSSTAIPSPLPSPAAAAAEGVPLAPIIGGVGGGVAIIALAALGFVCYRRGGKAGGGSSSSAPTRIPADWGVRQPNNTAARLAMVGAVGADVEADPGVVLPQSTVPTTFIGNPLEGVVPTPRQEYPPVKTMGEKENW